MSALVATVILEAAARVGAPIIKGLLKDKIGGTVGEIGGTVIDAIAAQAGVAPDQLPELPPPDLDRAIRRVEDDAPSLLAGYLASQKEANKLMLAEMGKENAFGWLWRPAGMWLMLMCIAWYIMGVPILGALLTVATGAPIEIKPFVSFSDFSTCFVTFAGLYMGGHTAKAVFKK